MGVQEGAHLCGGEINKEKDSHVSCPGEKELGDMLCQTGEWSPTPPLPPYPIQLPG
jgi:hypothetical protein